MANAIEKIKSKMPMRKREPWDEVDFETGEVLEDVPGLEESAGPDDLYGLGMMGAIKKAPGAALKTATTYLGKKAVKVPIPTDVPENVFRKLTNYVTQSGHINPNPGAFSEPYIETIKKAKEMFPELPPERVEEIANDMLQRAVKLKSKRDMK